MVQFLVALTIGMLLGRLLTPQGEFKQCPREIAGYDCKGYVCDHSDSAYYQAKMHEALNTEKFNNNGDF